MLAVALSGGNKTLDNLSLFSDTRGLREGVYDGASFPCLPTVPQACSTERHKRKVDTLRHTLSDANIEGSKQARKTHTGHTQRHPGIYAETETHAIRSTNPETHTIKTDTVRRSGRHTEGNIQQYR